MRKLLLALAIAASPAWADYVGTNATYTKDTDDLSTLKYGVSASTSAVLGVQYNSVKYNSPDLDKTGENVSLLVDYTNGAYKVYGSAGIGALTGENYFVGDIGINRYISDNLSIFAGIEGDIVDSVEGIRRGITYRGGHLGVDVSYQNTGLVFLVREADYSNGNTLEGWFGKAYVSPWDGVSVYVSTKQTNNSQVTSDFYSPKDYERYNLGLSVRRRIGNYIASGSVEGGRIDADGESGRANAWRVSLETPPSRKAISWKVSLAEDVADDTNYKYRMAMVEVKYHF